MKRDGLTTVNYSTLLNCLCTFYDMNTQLKYSIKNGLILCNLVKYKLLTISYLATWTLTHSALCYCQINASMHVKYAHQGSTLALLFAKRFCSAAAYVEFVSDPTVLCVCSDQLLAMQSQSLFQTVTSHIQVLCFLVRCKPHGTH